MSDRRPLIQQSEQRIMRVVHGQPIPAGWRVVQFLGVEIDMLYGPTFKADVLLLERVTAE